MKDIKTFAIGFLTCACLFLIMGQTKAGNQAGRYQVWKSYSDYDQGVIIDTQTGELFKYEQKSFWVDTPDRFIRHGWAPLDPLYGGVFKDTWDEARKPYAAKREKRLKEGR